MSQTDPNSRTFLFLQGPHGPFFGALARMLQAAGCRTWRVGFNAGDAAFWPDRDKFIACNVALQDWPDRVAALIDDLGVTDLVLYGDSRPVHAKAVAAAHARGLTIHVFEEGYLRPYWATYERGGSNGNSRLMDMGVAQMRAALSVSDPHAPLPPAHWGDMRQHVFYGALYHWFVLFRNNAYKHFRPHRRVPVRQEFRLHLRRLVHMPAHAINRQIATLRVRHGGFPYHVALLQLEHDSSFQTHSPFSTMTDFVNVVIEGFATGAPRHHHLVFKAHPLEDGRTPLRQDIRRLAKEHGITSRVHFVRGGKLAPLLDEARSVVTINSTAAQQALWRGIPLKAFGRAVYDKPEFVSSLPLPAFFSGAARPDSAAYRDFRRFLLETSQVPGGFYSRRGRRQLLRHVVDMMLSDEDPYDALLSGTAAPRQHLKVVG